ncbi:hypothetical protein [Marispirochaeta sp.]|uniref:hypothetical protein n=1 Tax=Marispirochaeta sp. TaxID=2038653 RepID=UPI0029C7E3B5|nr:hypothetical protein [Marispirochaeta sp.]
MPSRIAGRWGSSRWWRSRRVQSRNSALASSSTVAGAGIEILGRCIEAEIGDRFRGVQLLTDAGCRQRIRFAGARHR